MDNLRRACAADTGDGARVAYGRHAGFGGEDPRQLARGRAEGHGQLRRVGGRTLGARSIHVGPAENATAMWWRTVSPRASGLRRQ